MDVMVVFPTTHLTLKAEKALDKEGLSYRTVLKPRKISSDCGLALRIDEADVQKCRDALHLDSLTPAGFYRESINGWERFLKVEGQNG